MEVQYLEFCYPIRGCKLLVLVRPEDLQRIRIPRIASGISGPLSSSGKSRGHTRVRA